MTQKPKPLQQMQGKPKCVHHFILKDNLGLESKGVCQKCGEERMFKNTFDAKYGRNYPELLEKEDDGE